MNPFDESINLSIEIDLSDTYIVDWDLIHNTLYVPNAHKPASRLYAASQAYNAVKANECAIKKLSNKLTTNLSKLDSKVNWLNLQHQFLTQRVDNIFSELLKHNGIQGMLEKHKKEVEDMLSTQKTELVNISAQEKRLFTESLSKIWREKFDKEYLETPKFEEEKKAWRESLNKDILRENEQLKKEISAVNARLNYTGYGALLGIAGCLLFTYGMSK